MTSWQSCLYRGAVVHRRFSPVRHRLRYDVYSLFVDIDELATVDRRLRVLSYNEANILSIHDKDHGLGRDINPDGLIVGTYRIGTTVRGFVRTGDSYATIHYPGSTGTRTFGINASGDVVGNYVLAGKTYAYLASVVEE